MIVDMRFRPPYRGFLSLHVFARDPYDQRPGQQLVGTAYPARPMVESIEHFHRLPFDEDVKPRVLGLNAARVFGLT